MKKRNQKLVRPSSKPAALGHDDLAKVSGGAAFPPGQFPGDMPPGQFPAPVKPGWHPGK